MKRIGLVFCVILLLLSTACGQQADVAYQQGQAELKNGNYEKAYAYFKESADPRAAEVLERLVFVPLEETAVTSFKDGVDRRTYTYDERGNLIREDSVFEGVESVTEYTYNEQDWLLSVRDANSTSTYTYDERGNRLTYVNELDEGGVYKEEYEYDEQGNLLKSRVTMRDGTKLIRYPQEEESIASDGAISTGTCTYDDAGRLLTETYANGEQFAYTYDEYGNKLIERYTWNETTIEWTYRWQLRYYPDGLSEPVKKLRDSTVRRQPVA